MYNNDFFIRMFYSQNFNGILKNYKISRTYYFRIYLDNIVFAGQKCLKI